MASGKEWGDVSGITFRQGEELFGNPDRPFIQDIDSIPYPARHLIDNRIYIRPDVGELQTTVVTSRGCPFTCVFCLAQPVSGAKVRNRSPENVVGELKECVEQYGIRHFLFRSDLFTANRKWVFTLCEKIKEEGLDIQWACNSRADTIQEDLLLAMKDAGCWLIAFGVESGDPQMLEKMRKQLKFEKIEPAIQTCRKTGIKSSVYFLIGLPWENRETFDKSKNLAKQLNPDFVEFFYSYPFYGTDFYREAVKEGLLQEGELPHMAYNHPALPTKYLSKEELEPMRKEALRSFYLRPGYILKTLAQNPSPKVLKNYFVYGMRQLRDLMR
ncbi:radical SAM protein [bacterium]|nr:radical SAM protein [bacterium]